MNSNNINTKHKNGSIYTKPEIVSFMLDEIGYVDDKNLSQISIMEPSCGEGVFIYSTPHFLTTG